jgi:hypothetical protein
MSDSFLSFNNSANFRDQLIARNLPPYNVPGTFSSSQSQQNYETNLIVSNVIDSSDELIATNQLANTLYPLNEYGPDGGFQGKYSVPGSPYPVDSNSGPYNPDDTNLDLVNEFYIDAAYVQNIYGPEGGYSDLVVITDVVGPEKLYQPYWDPSSFVSSTYSPYDILFSNDPTGSNGPLSQDTYLAQIGAQQLKTLFEERIAAELVQSTIGRVNLDSLQDPFSAALVATGKEPLIEKNWKISQPESPIGAAISFANRLTGTYFPVSPIPGTYFNDADIQAPLLEKGLNVANNLTGGLLGPILDIYRNPSETFVANTGNGQRSILFSTLDYNKYRPSYNRGILQSITTGVDRLLDGNKPNTAGYYVGSKNAEPSQIESPANEIPIGPNGRQINTIVYGPQELGILYEGNEGLIQNGLAGKSLTDGGGIAGQFVWTSPKYKDNAGFKQGPGGVPTNLDNEFAVISSDYLKYESTNIPFKEGSILDQTQRLVESADKVSGAKRLKHVGNAINQVSKVFNDGYKELTKGSKVLSYRNDSDGTEAGIEYCRVFTKDTPYYTYADLQKTDGITTEGRKFTYSVFDKTYNLNIAPLKNPGSTNIMDNKVKKYMLSLENLAWRTSDRPGYTYDDLPVCERGPNGGRIMWFPPYDVKFSDDSTPSWNPTKFLGRPEPIYTYQHTDRKGTLSFKIVVDHPSVINAVVQKQLKNIPQERVDSMVDSFYAGCLKYDLYELGIKFNTIPTRDLFTYQQVLNNPRLTDEELGQVAFELPVNIEANATNGDATNGDSEANTAAGGAANTTVEAAPDPITLELGQYEGYGFYFHNDRPDPNTRRTTATAPFDSWYNSYVGLKSEYQTKAPSEVRNGKNEGDPIFSGDAVSNVFESVVEGNFTEIKKLMDEVGDALQEGGTVSFTLLGSASPVASVSYNVDLSKRRINSVIQWIESLTDKNNKTFKEYIEEKKLNIKENPQGEESTVAKDTKGTLGLLSSEISCTQNIQEKISGNWTTTKTAEVYSVPAMACRRVLIQDLQGTKPGKKEQEEEKEEVAIGGSDSKDVDTNENIQKTPSDSIKPSPNITIEQKIKDGISKKILRFLFSECDYFEVLKETDPIVFQSIKEKIKHFNPTFHSMTPEGLNSRLTFLNQCVRPGQTIPVIGADGRPKYNDALNTAFGAPPILVLRVGDFYHSKIVPESVQFQYTDVKWDINPEGIGLQPMIVDVTMNFKFIGGHGLKNPVEELQNALSFNFYANTEVYDERATPTEDVSARDKYVVEKILANQPPIKTVDIQNQIPKKGGETIGIIISDTEIDYTTKINDFWDSTSKYFEAYVDMNVSINKNFNKGIVNLLFSERDYVEGTFDEYNEGESIEIYGKPKDVEDKVDKLFERTIKDLSNDAGEFMFWISDAPIKNREKREIRKRLELYISNMKEEFSLTLNNEYTPFVELQQEYIQNIREFNLILTKTDGSLDPKNQAKVYDLSGDTVLNDIKTTINSIRQKHIDFSDSAEGVVKNDLLLSLKPLTTENFYKKNKSKFSDNRNLEGKIISPSWTKSNADPALDPDNRLFQVMGNTFYTESKKQELKEFLLNSTVYENKLAVEKAINTAITKCSQLYTSYIQQTNDLYSEIKDSVAFNKIIESPLSSDKKYILNYKIEDGTNQQKNRIKDLYSQNNLNNKRKTFDGKVKFN